MTAGCGLSESQRVALSNGEDAYRRQQYDRANRELTTFLSDASDKPQAADAYYIRGQACARLGKRGQAYSDLKQAIQVAHEDGVRWRAGVALGSLYFEDGDWGGAATAYESAVRVMPASPPLDTVLYRLAQSLQRLGRWRDAQPYFHRVTAEFRRSPLSESAARMVESGVNYFAIQAGVFGLKSNADNMVRTLAGAGLGATVRSEARSSRTVHVVYVGRFNTYADANRTLPTVRRYATDAVIWP